MRESLCAIRQGAVEAVLPFLVVVVAICALIGGALLLISKVRGSIPKNSWVFVIASSVLGSFVGFSMGASMTPVVGELVPAILAAAGALQAFVLARDTFKEWRPPALFGFFAFVTATALATELGSFVRRDREEYDRRYDEWSSYYKEVVLPSAKRWYERRIDRDSVSGTDIAVLLKQTVAQGDAAPSHCVR